MDILMVGTGYVGLVTGACFAEMGHRVICLDIDQERIQGLKQGKLPFFEPGLEEIVKRGTDSGRLSFTTDYSEGVSKSKIFFIAVTTPALEDGSCNLAYVFQAASSLAKVIEEDKVIVIKSTVPVGTSTLLKKEIRDILQERNKTYALDVVSNPEFLKEGSAVSDSMKPDRILIGTDNPQSAQLMKDLYSPFSINHDRILIMDNPSAEMTKYAANAMLATRISFMNELAGLCERVGANINDVRVGIGSDSRIGYHFLYAGVGFGGSCFPKDLKALQAMGRTSSYKMSLIDAVLSVNMRQKQILAEKIHSYFETSGGVRGKTIAIWGLSFKPDTDDLREAPSLELIQELRSQGATVRLYDPIALSPFKKQVGAHFDIHYAENEYDAAEGADAIALMTEWKQFRFIDFDKIRTRMKRPTLFDGRNQYKKEEMSRKGFEYFAIGVP